MSFLGGPECGTGSNPLAQFQKQVSADTSLQRDRLTARQPLQQNGFRTTQPRPDDTAFQEFAHSGPRLDGMLPNEAFHLEQLRREAEQFERSGGGGGGGSADARWASEFSQQTPLHQPQQQQQMNPAFFRPQDFASFRQAQFPQREQSPTFQQQSAYRSPMMGSTFGMHGPMQFQPQMWNQPPQQQQQYEGKGKGRVQELSDTDWEKQFAELSTTDKEEEDQERLDREAERAVEAELNQLDRSETGPGDFESIMQGIQQEADANRDMLADEEIAKHFGDEFNQWKDFDGYSHSFDGLRTDMEGYGTAAHLGDYLFEENNVFTDKPNAFEEGQKIVREGGNLSLAALAFEAAVQQRQDFVEAWVALGQAQAQNEKEAPAIRALEHAVKLDPQNLEGLMGLAVSYTNEGFDTLAHRTLERWLGARYPELGIAAPLDDVEEMGFTNRVKLHEKVTELFLQAAQLHPEGADVDVDVQVGLGVLFYGSEDYEKAVDCFTAALNSHQHGSMKKEGQEHLLWNRLGATLANSSRSEEAIEAYSRALELRPNFVRARYNLGVSCINLGVLDEAAAHLLGALSMHRVLEDEGRAKAAELLRDGVGNAVDPDRAVDQFLHQNQSTNLYDTLRRVFTQMNRRELANLVGPDMDMDALRGEFDF